MNILELKDILADHELGKFDPLLSFDVEKHKVVFGLYIPDDSTEDEKIIYGDRSFCFCKAFDDSLFRSSGVSWAHAFRCFLAECQAQHKLHDVGEI